MTSRDQAQPPPVEARHTITVTLTAREIAAVRGVAFVVTSPDDRDHRVNFAEAALKRFQQAVRDQRP
ncbi:hypothetical protein [Actinosynnema sp. NPDC023587]|uniref:hypothetical protein n=1 Tax=Actinosynnema sp. NPDC023587 TaxID=3154695 RepID=UPI00341164F7